MDCYALAMDVARGTQTHRISGTMRGGISADLRRDLSGAQEGSHLKGAGLVNHTTLHSWVTSAAIGLVPTTVMSIRNAGNSTGVARVCVALAFPRISVKVR